MKQRPSPYRPLLLQVQTLGGSHGFALFSDFLHAQCPTATLTGMESELIEYYISSLSLSLLDLPVAFVCFLKLRVKTSHGKNFKEPTSYFL